ncbi:hypothetical protein SAMN00790413_04827 [Deinococcus hopiensis KR-140]|uniref:Uncharacterized protein n=1 Tax=Deinococcus hopiensis KR-140 TaxID=695939 RepID=A0A1W1ULR1_9DEIO|nr:hypothetical protein SAMN00790413_04827 [Deinococcus hopiensis KR-140]
MSFARTVEIRGFLFTTACMGEVSLVSVAGLKSRCSVPPVMFVSDTSARLTYVVSAQHAIGRHADPLQIHSTFP